MIEPGYEVLTMKRKKADGTIYLKTPAWSRRNWPTA